MLKVVEPPKPEPTLWEQVVLARPLEPFYEWIGLPEYSHLGVVLPVLFVTVIVLVIVKIRKKIHRNSNVGFVDKGY